MRLRIAVSPTHLLHVPEARAALATWLLARRNGGQVSLRLEDADPERNDQGDAAQQDLAWLGLDWDDLVHTRDRLPAYEAAADRLRTAGRLYPCFESDEELASKREARIRRGLSPIYDRAMLKLTAAQRAAAEAGGKRPYWRFLLSGVPAEWGDMVLGRQEVKLSATSDPVLIRADGTPLLAFTTAVDDLEDGITHIVRGQGDTTLTGLQLDLLAALRPTTGRGRPPPPPRFAHLPPLADDSGGKLAKRRGGLSLRSLRNDGIEPTALAGTLAALGTGATPVPTTPAGLAPGFDLTRIAPEPPRFDPAYLLKTNRQALAAMPFEAAQPRLPPAATPAFWHAIRGSLDLMREARGWWDVASGAIVPPFLEGEHEFLATAMDHLPPDPWGPTTWSDWTTALRERSGRKGKALNAPLRLALTGEDHGPDLADLLPLIGRTRALDRLRLAAA